MGMNPGGPRVLDAKPLDHSFDRAPQDETSRIH